MVAKVKVVSAVKKPNWLYFQVLLKTTTTRLWPKNLLA